MEVIAEDRTLAQPAPARAVGTASEPAGRVSTALAADFLCFRLGAQEFGIDIRHVQEIRSYEQPTRTAHAPAFVKGVVNLRGALMPVIDLRLMWGFVSARYDSATVVLVLDLAGRVVGVVADAVHDVLPLSEEQIRPAPPRGASTEVLCINGIGEPGSKAADIGGRGSERKVMLMDIERLMGTAGMALG